MKDRYTLATRVIDGIAYGIERLMPGHPEAPYRFFECSSDKGSYDLVGYNEVEERLVSFFGLGRMQAKAAIRRANQWAKEVRYEPFPSVLDANSSSTENPADGSRSKS